MDDPLPYGIEPNRDTLEKLIGHAVTQKIISEPLAMEDLVAKSVLDTVA
jgi:4,5-dihydroxyphthalate decarboxylase